MSEVSEQFDLDEWLDAAYSVYWSAIHSAEKAASGYGITDPDNRGNISLDEFSVYVCCLKKI